MPILSSSPSYAWFRKVTRSLIAAAALLGAPVWSQAADLVALSADRVNATLAQDTIWGKRYWWPSDGHIWWALALWVLGAWWIWLRDPKRREKASERLARMMTWLSSLRKDNPPDEEFRESDIPSDNFSHREWQPSEYLDSDSVGWRDAQWEIDPIAEYDIYRSHWLHILALEIFADYMNSSNHPNTSIVEWIQKRLIRDRKDDENEEVTTLRKGLLIRTIESLWVDIDLPTDQQQTMTTHLASIAHTSVPAWPENTGWMQLFTPSKNNIRDWAEYYWEGIPFDVDTMALLLRRYCNQEIWSREESLLEECLKHSSKPLEECILLLLLRPFRPGRQVLQERFLKIFWIIEKGKPEDIVDFIIFLLDHKEQFWWIGNPAYAMYSRIFNLSDFTGWWRDDQTATEKRVWMIGMLRNIFARISRRRGGAWGSTAWQGSGNHTGGPDGLETIPAEGPDSSRQLLSKEELMVLKQFLRDRETVWGADQYPNEVEIHQQGHMPSSDRKA